MGRLQFLDPLFKPGLFSAGTFPLGLELLVRLLQLLLQLPQFGFQLSAALPKLHLLPLGLFAASGLFSQRIGQSLDLLFHLRLGGLQFLGAGLQQGRLGAGTLFPLGL